jgi:superfamily II DNA or RNA helicase
MIGLTVEVVKDNIAKSEVVFSRGENIFFLGNYTLESEDADRGSYTYAIDGTYGDYAVSVSLQGDKVKARCSCPYPYGGCKHIVAACLDIARRLARHQRQPSKSPASNEYLTPGEIKNLALEGRKERARKEALTLVRGETYKGTHVVRTGKSIEYTVTVYSPAERTGHCTCPDFATNHLETCKHLLFSFDELEQSNELREQAEQEIFPFVHITWNSRLQAPTCYYEKVEDPELLQKIQNLFNEKGIYIKKSIDQLYRLYHISDGSDALQFDDFLLNRLEDILYRKEVAKLERKFQPDYSIVSAELYPYQKEGIRFATFKKAAIIADEMGLGKTLQAITVALLKKRLFGFSKVLVISPSSLKEQWKREINKYASESAVVVAGGKKKRQEIYASDEAFFKITNYEAVLRDVLAISRWRPDFIILDEAQRIKNFETKTHQALLSLPRNHSLVITGTPLENKLEDVYSIAQFSDRALLTPLWAFAANHLNMSRDKRNRVLGYRNLEAVHKKLKELIIRRSKEQVFDSLPDQIENNYYLDLSQEQGEIHHGYLTSLFAIINKKILTPMDVKRIQKILLSMRMVCDSTFLIDRKTNISPKLVELVSILKELVLSNRRKVIIFTEWTTMTYLIGKVLSELGINFVEFTGKVPVKKRHLLIEQFRSDPDCMVFLSTDAGGLGLNLQNADCIVNFELPWNPARLNQRIGRVNRLGQKSSKINVINLICKNSIEEKVLAGINIKQELFDAVLEGGTDEIDLSKEKKTKLINQVRILLGEEPTEPPYEAPPSPELDERTPHYLNPQILRDRELDIDVAADEFGETVVEDDQRAGERTETVEAERIESVLNQGLAFLNSISQMATGKALADESSQKAIEIDRETGEVVLRFKLPGF